MYTPDTYAHVTRSARFYDLVLPFWGSEDKRPAARPPQRRLREVGELDDNAGTCLPAHAPLALMVTGALARAHMECVGLSIAHVQFTRRREWPLSLPPCAEAMSTPPQTTQQHVFSPTETAVAHLTFTVSALPVSTSGLVHSLWWINREKSRSDARCAASVARSQACPADTERTAMSMSPPRMPRCSYCHRTVLDQMHDPLGYPPHALRLALCLKGEKRTRTAFRALVLRDLLLVTPESLHRGTEADLLGSVKWYGQLFSLRLEQLSLDPALLRRLSTWVSPALRVLQFAHCSGAFSPLLRDNHACAYTRALAATATAASTSTPLYEDSMLPDEEVFGMTGLSSLTCTHCSGEGFWRGLVHFAIAPHYRQPAAASTSTAEAEALEPIPTRPLAYLDLSDANIAAKTLGLVMDGVQHRNHTSYDTFGDARSSPYCFALQELSLAGISQWTDLTWLSESHFFLGGALRTLVMPRNHLTERDVHTGLVAFLSAPPPASQTTTKGLCEDEESAAAPPVVLAPPSHTEQGVSPRARRMWILDARWNLNTDNRLLRALMKAGITAQHFRYAGTDTTTEVSKQFATVLTP